VTSLARFHDRAEVRAKRALLHAVGSHQEAGGKVAEELVEAWFGVVRSQGGVSALTLDRRR
jgi:hypothetical protein